MMSLLVARAVFERAVVRLQACVTSPIEHLAMAPVDSELAIATWVEEA